MSTTRSPPLLGTTPVLGTTSAPATYRPASAPDSPAERRLLLPAGKLEPDLLAAVPALCAPAARQLLDQVQPPATGGARRRLAHRRQVDAAVLYADPQRGRGQADAQGERCVGVH